ncbi:hypothetical protein CFS9_03870 [Flavobacterium sp. CFS9]|uniref:Head domain of trimeric autotransporter adhesin n=1 Tax=Flavobacterium sp. CFS9 TaxID=3143118 RepID=A0AAT9GWW9_9FLAO
MKRILLFLLFALSFTAFAQVQIPQEYTIQKPLRLATVNPGKKADSVLVRGSDNIVKFIPQSSLKGSPNLDQVLGTGNSTDTIVKIRTIEIGNVIVAGVNPPTDGILFGPALEDSEYSTIQRGRLTSYYYGSESQVNGKGIYVQSDKGSEMSLDSKSLTFSGNGFSAELSYAGEIENPHRKILIPMWDQIDPLEREKNIPLVINGQSADEYGNLDIDLNSGIPPAFIKINEGNGFGIIRADRNAAYFGNIGEDAVDLSNSYGESSTVGATGFGSTIGGGFNNTNANSFGVISGGHNNKMIGGHDSYIGGGDRNSTDGADYAVIVGGQGNKAISRSYVLGGQSNEALAYGSVILGGNSNKTLGESSSVLSGSGNIAQSLAETVLGQYSTNYSPGSNSGYIGTDRIFNIGNGRSDSSTEWSPSRSDALTVLKNGLATLPSVTNALIEAELTGKAVLTKEYLDARIGKIAPASAIDTGSTGEIRIANGYIYWCIAPNSWIRTSGNTW